MVNINNVYPSKYVSAGDLKGRDVTVTISRLAIEKMANNNEERPVLYFDRADKGMVLNKTNASTIAALYGPETDNWPGKSITLFGTDVDFQGSRVPAIRVRPAVPGNNATQPTAPVQQQTAVLDGDVDESDIPF